MLFYGVILLPLVYTMYTVEEPQWDKFDNMMIKLMDCRPSTAAFTISAVKDGKEVFINAYGFANKEKKIKATNNTRFSIGSISKTFSSYLVGTYVEKGDFSWDDTIVKTFEKYHTKFSFKNSFSSESATISDALSHRTGVKQYDWLLADNRTLTRAEWITKIFPLFEQFSDLRLMFYYCNWLYTMAGYLIELAGKATYESQIKSKVFTPLNMKETCFVSDREFDSLSGAQFSQPYKEISNGSLYQVPRSALKTIGMHNPAGGIVTTANDMAKYMVAIMNAYNGKASPLSENVMRMITKTHSTVPIQLGDPSVVEKPQFPESWVDQGYGLGYIVGFYRGLKYINHGGSAHGHYSYMTMIPSKGVAVFTAISGDDFKYQDSWRAQKVIHMYMLDVLMGESPWITLNNACTFPKPWKTIEEPPIPAIKEDENTVIADSQRFLGNYHKPEFPAMKIFGTHDNLKFEMGNINGTIVPIDNVKLQFAAIVNLPVDPINLPAAEKQRALITFQTDKFNKSKVRGLTLTVFPESFDFTKNNAETVKSLIPTTFLFLITLIRN